MIFHYYSTFIIETDCLHCTLSTHFFELVILMNRHVFFAVAEFDNYLAVAAYHASRPAFGMLFQRSMIVALRWQILSARRYLTC
jgi:hypothetical protein